MDCTWTPVFRWDLTAAIWLLRMIKCLLRKGIVAILEAIMERVVTVCLPRMLLSADPLKLFLSCRLLNTTFNTPLWFIVELVMQVLYF